MELFRRLGGHFRGGYQPETGTAAPKYPPSGGTAAEKPHNPVPPRLFQAGKFPDRHPNWPVPKPMMEIRKEFIREAIMNMLRSGAVSTQVVSRAAHLWDEFEAETAPPSTPPPRED